VPSGQPRYDAEAGVWSLDGKVVPNPIRPDEAPDWAKRILDLLVKQQESPAWVEVLRRDVKAFLGPLSAPVEGDLMKVLDYRYFVAEGSRDAVEDVALRAVRSLSADGKPWVVTAATNKFAVAVRVDLLVAAVLRGSG